MTSFPDDAFLEEAKAAMTEWERRKMEMQERKDAVKKEYQRVVTSRKNVADYAMVKTAQDLRKAVDNNEYDSILSILDKAVLPYGYTFGIKPCVTEGDFNLGDWSRPFIQAPDGKRSESIFEFFRFEDSSMGAWQAFLLHQMWHYLPLWWHANYDWRHYHYSQEDAPVFNKPLPYFQKKVFISPDFSRFNLAPEIYHEGGDYYVSSCFWSSFGGLIREYVRLTFKEGRLDGFFVFDEQTLVEYDCGICF